MRHSGEKPRSIMRCSRSFMRVRLLRGGSITDRGVWGGVGGGGTARRDAEKQRRKETTGKRILASALILWVFGSLKPARGLHRHPVFVPSAGADPTGLRGQVLPEEVQPGVVEDAVDVRVRVAAV